MTVRGPLSQRLLAEQGIESSIVGDPALLLLKKTIRSSPEQRLVGVNTGTSLGMIHGADEEKMLRVIRKTCAELQTRGWEIELYSIWPRDDAYSVFLARNLPRTARVVRCYTNSSLFQQEVARCAVFLGMKLHSTVLALCSHVPSIMLEYRPKCRDFMASVGLERYCLRTDELDDHELVSLVESVSAKRSDFIKKFCQAAEVYIEKMHALADRIKQAVS